MTTNPRALTFLDLYTRGLAYLDMDLAQAEADGILEDVKTWVNEAVEELWTAHPWPWHSSTINLNTVADQEYVVLPTDFAFIPADSGPRYTQNFAYTLTRSTRAAVQQARESIDYAATPSLWYIDQRVDTSVQRKVLELYPKPNAVLAITFRYQRAPVVMANAADKPDVDPDVMICLSPLIRAVFQESHENVEVSQARTRYEVLLARAIETVSRRDRGRAMPLAAQGSLLPGGGGGGDAALDFTITLP